MEHYDTGMPTSPSSVPVDVDQVNTNNLKLPYATIAELATHPEL